MVHYYLKPIGPGNIYLFLLMEIGCMQMTLSRSFTLYYIYLVSLFLHPVLYYFQSLDGTSYSLPLQVYQSQVMCYMFQSIVSSSQENYFGMVYICLRLPLGSFLCSEYQKHIYLVIFSSCVFDFVFLFEASETYSSLFILLLYILFLFFRLYYMCYIFFC